MSVLEHLSVDGQECVPIFQAQKAIFRSAIWEVEGSCAATMRCDEFSYFSHRSRGNHLTCTDVVKSL
jgi:hypothetical protein